MLMVIYLHLCAALAIFPQALSLLRPQLTFKTGEKTMKIRFTAITLLLFSAVCSAPAAPVLYSFNFTGAVGTAPTNLSFQYLSPSYITGSSLFVNAINLSNISIDPSYSLFSVVLSQNNLPTYTFVDVQATILEKFDFNQPVTIDFSLSNGPSGPNTYLDRDGTYTKNLTNGSGQVTFSVMATPEPSTVSFLLLTAFVACVGRAKRRVQR